MLRVEDSHESESGRAIEFARVEENGRDRDLTLELLQQRERAIKREESPDSNNEAQVPGRLAWAWDGISHKLVERAILAQDLVHSLYRYLDPNGSLRLDLLLESEFLRKGYLKPFGE